MTSRPALSSQSSSSVFDRLYSKSTESSRLRKSAGKEEDITRNIAVSNSVGSIKKNVPNNRRLKAVTKPNTNVRSKTGTGSSEVYNRLYSKGTASYNSKRKAVATQSQREPSNNKIGTMIPLKTTTNTK